MNCNNLVKLRTQNNFTMKDIAKRLNIPYTTYVSYEKGQREPNCETLIKLANLYNTSVDYIIGNSATILSYSKFCDNKMTVYERIKYLREERGMSQQELAERVGYKTASAVNKIELGLRDINQSKIVEFAKALNTTPSYLLGDDQFNIFSIPNIIPIPKMKEIPLLETIACGEPITAIENIETYITVDAKANVDFALKCKGDSMINARIFDGDIVYIHSQPDVENGEIASVLIDGEATLKKVYKYPNKLVLSPCNPTHNDLIYAEEQLENVRILGKAVLFVSVVR